MFGFDFKVEAKGGDATSQIAQSGQVLRGVIGAGQTAVFGESDITHKMGSGFDLPMIPQELGKELWAEAFGAAIGNEQLDIMGDFDFFEMMSGANEQRALGGVGEVNDLLLAQIKNKELMGLMTSMALIGLSVCREKKNPPREPARRVDPVDWVGWL